MFMKAYISGNPIRRRRFLMITLVPRTPMINLNVTARLPFDALEERLPPVVRILYSRLFDGCVYRRSVVCVWIVLE